MFGIRYLKAPPTTFIQQYQGGRVRREGPGLSFFYYAPVTNLVAVPLASKDAPFIFSEVTADFQTVTVQGQLSFRVVDPGKLAELFDMSVDAELQYLSEDHEKLTERLVQAAQILTRGSIQDRTLHEVLTASEGLSDTILKGLQTEESVQAMGLQVLSVVVLAIRPTPETSKALEAKAREGLLREADEAIYSRRNASVEQERRIRESELNTEIAVEEKKRSIREKQMATEIAVEESRAQLMDTRVANEKKEADSRAYAVETMVEKLQDVDWRKLMVMNNGADPQALIALAFQDLAGSAAKIGTLNISPELLASLKSNPE